MLNELVAFGKSIRPKDAHDALKEEHVSIDIVITSEGHFVGFTVFEKMNTLAEALQSKKGKARLLLDKAEEVLNFDNKKHGLFIKKLDEYSHLHSIKPVLAFYNECKRLGIEKAQEAFEEIPEKKRKENFAFIIHGDNTRLHEKEDVQQAIINAYEERLRPIKNPQGLVCAVCFSTNRPIIDEPHGMIKRVPAGQSSGCALISYNEKAYESYEMKGNENSSICTACARNYVEGLNFLLNNGSEFTPEKGKKYFKFSHRKNLSSDTAMIFWTKNQQHIEEIEYVDNTQIYIPDIENLFSNDLPIKSELRSESLLSLLSSPFSANKTSLQSIDVDRFYSCMLSGAAARIAIRNWIESSTHHIRDNIKVWFHDIAIQQRDYETKTLQIRFFSLRELALACVRHQKKEMQGKIVYSAELDDVFLGHVSALLWQCALCQSKPAYMLLDRILRRVRMEEGRVTAQRAALLKLILNRNNIYGGQRMQPQLDQENHDIAYMAGRIFSLLAYIQTAALGKELNAPMKERFFSSASTTPASAFGRLMKMSNNHLSKLRGEKPGFAISFEKKLQELYASIPSNGFPAIFNLEEQGRFAIGFYHQQQSNYSSSEENTSNT